MLVDARTLSAGTEIDTDICIIGGGAAGITLARSFIATGRKVALLESGGLTPEEQTQALYQGKDIGQPYTMFSRSRFRYLGGTTNRWGGAWCDLPSPLDFEHRDGVPYSGWPVTFDEMKPWYEKAQPALRLGPYAYDPEDWGILPDAVPEPFKGPDLVTRVLQQAPTTRFGKYYRKELERARNVTVYLNANALTLETGDKGDRVTHVNVGVLPDTRLTVTANTFILSCGGIEAARLLLLSKGADGKGIGNQNDLVGRFFQLHLEYTGGTIHQDDPMRELSFQTGENGAQYKRQGRIRRFVSYISLADSTKRRMGLSAVRYRFRYPRSPELNVLWRLYHRTASRTSLLPDLMRVIRKSPDLAVYIFRRVRYGRNKPPVPLNDIPVTCTAEQFPNPESRVFLGDDLDAFGLRKIVVDWQLTREDHRGMVAANEILDEELKRSGFGTLTSAVPEQEMEWPADMRGDQHHMGTTRMSRDPKTGVVDENCKVHGVSNLFISSSAVFPTSGTFNPTLTILALAMRLSEHIKQR